jgi:tRNA A-37 threonylcarbamoyl transferase component Bud32
VDSKKYKVIQTVATGGTAVLFKAVQTSLDRLVAVKRLHQHLTDDENFTNRFILEAKAAASLDHENIVHVIDFGHDGDCYQMVMEYVEGESLSDILERWRPIKYDLALAIVRQICLGLEHAHSKGIVHRDIKPGNVMLTPTGRAKITDFGLAKLTQSNTSQTAANAILGTPLYMSPEQAFGESVDNRSDLFSLGTLLYELLTGKQPFVSENYMGVIQNIINKDIPDVREYDQTIPDEVAAIVTKALAKNRENRFQTAREFREAVESFLGLERLSHATANLKILLEKSPGTQILPEAAFERRRRGKPSRLGGFALGVFVLAAAATIAVVMKPSLLDYVRLAAQPPESPAPHQQSALGEADAYQFDVSELIGEQPAAADSDGAAPRQEESDAATHELHMTGDMTEVFKPNAPRNRRRSRRRAQRKWVTSKSKPDPAPRSTSTACTRATRPRPSHSS